MFQLTEEEVDLMVSQNAIPSKQDGQERGERVWLVDFQNPANNVFYAINQFTVIEPPS